MRLRLVVFWKFPCTPRLSPTILGAVIHRTALIVLVLAAFFTVAPAGGVPIPVIANGVTIGDVEVGGLIAVAAQDRVERTYGQPIHLFHKDSSVAVSPARFGAEAAIEKSVKQAMNASPGAHLQLDVVIKKRQVDKFIASSTAASPGSRSTRSSSASPTS